MICSCCGQTIKENKTHNERPKQENLIANWVKSNDKINWNYSNIYYKRIGWKYPLTHASQEIQLRNFYFQIDCFVNQRDRQSIDGRIQIRILINGRKHRIDVIDLEGINDITTNKIWDMIQDWIGNNTNILCDNCKELKEAI